MYRQRSISCLLIIALFVFISCKDEKPVEVPDGTWLKYSSTTDGELIGTLILKDSSLFIFTASAEGHDDTNGRYSLSGDHITFEDDECYSPGSYLYSLSKTDLKLEKISDKCEKRAKTLSGRWERN